MALERELDLLRRDLARFERRSRIVWLAGLAALAMTVVLWTGARQALSQSASLAARQIVLVDIASRPRMILTSDTNNRPAMVLRDEAGNDRLRFGFGAQPASPLFFLADETGRTRLIAGFSVEHGDPQMSLFDQAGRSRVFLGFHVQLRMPQLVLDDEQGKDRLSAGWAPDRAPAIHVADAGGKAVWKSGDVPGPAPGAGGGRTPATTPKPGIP